MELKIDSRTWKISYDSYNICNHAWDWELIGIFMLMMFVIICSWHECKKKKKIFL